MQLTSYQQPASRPFIKPDQEGDAFLWGNVNRKKIGTGSRQRKFFDRIEQWRLVFRKRRGKWPQFVNDGCTLRNAAERELGSHTHHFRAKQRVDAGGPCLGVRGRPSVLSNKSLDDLKRIAKLRDLGQNSFSEVQLMDALTKRIVAEQKAARCASSSDESSDEREIENMAPRKVVSDRTM